MVNSKDFVHEWSHNLRFCFVLLFTPFGLILYYILRPFKEKLFPSLHSIDNLLILATYGLITVLIAGLICISLGFNIAGYVCIGAVIIALSSHFIYVSTCK